MAVAHDGHDAVLLPLEVARARESERGRNGGGGVRGPEGVVFALRSPREAREPALLAQGLEALIPSGEDLVDVGLVAGIPDEAVARSLEGVVQSDGELGHPKARSEVTSDLRDHIDMPLPNLSSEELELPLGQGRLGKGSRRRNDGTDRLRGPHAPDGLTSFRLSL